MSLNPSNDTTHIGWQSEPSLRGTYTIISSCVSTLLICVLSAVHLNIPAKGHAGWDQTLRKAKWVCAGVFTPEVLALAAFIQFDAAKTMTTKAQHLMKDVHSQPVSTALEEPADIEVALLSSPTEIISRRHQWTALHSFFASSGGFCVDVSSSSEPQFRALTLNGILFLMKNEPASIPDLSREDILERSKTSSLAKSIALVQILWFCAQCVARLAARLPISLLELNTFVHGLFALGTYVLWWNKPLDVTLSITLTITNTEITRTQLCEGHRTSVRMPMPFIFSEEYIDENGDDVPWGTLGFWTAFLTVLYGALHAAAWTSNFPSSWEAICWRASASIIIGTGLAIFLLIALSSMCAYVDDVLEFFGVSETIEFDGLRIIFIPVLLLSCVARLFIIVESFRSLWFLPASAYELPTWSTYIPHFS